jgi:2-polyprenyl-3-methyl-5-hydroxy-6-metoxy-1,4-benzoquinol methylase
MKECTKVNSEGEVFRACPLCQTCDARGYMRPNAWNNRTGIELKKCVQCSFVYSASFWGRYEEAGAQHSTKTKHELFALAQHERLHDLVDEIIKKSGLHTGTVLDFGCGVGLQALCVQEKGFQVYGVEQSRAFLAKHTELGIISAAHLAQLELEQQSCDLVIIKDVLEHVDNPAEILADVLAYLKPGGYLYLRVPNVYHYPFHWSVDTKFHVNHFSPKTVTQLLEKNNAKIVDFISVYDISTRIGKLYNGIFWRTKKFLPLYHQISLLCQKC